MNYDINVYIHKSSENIILKTETEKKNLHTLVECSVKIERTTLTSYGLQEVERVRNWLRNYFKSITHLLNEKHLAF